MDDLIPTEEDRRIIAEVEARYAMVPDAGATLAARARILRAVEAAGTYTLTPEQRRAARAA